MSISERMGSHCYNKNGLRVDSNFQILIVHSAGNKPEVITAYSLPGQTFRRDV